MSKTASVRTATRTRNLQQAFILLGLGGILLVAAQFFPLSTGDYPIGVFVFGFGMLIAAVFNPVRLIVASSLTTMLGIAVFLTFKHLIPGNQVLAVFILAIGLGLLIIALMTRWRYVGSGAVTPGIIVAGVGIIEVLLAARLTPPNFIPFMLSLWLPGLGLLAIGIIYALTSSKS